MIFQKELIKSLKSYSNRTAIENNGNSVSYTDLFNISNKITNFLIKEKIGEQTLIGIQLNDKTDLICAIIGALNARCVFVPIDDSLPDDRILSIYQDLNLQYLISSKEISRNIILSKIPTLQNYFLEDILNTQEEKSETLIQYPEYNENDSIYIYFTSGSTGKPKGIVGKNSSLLQFIKWEIESFNIDHTFRISQFTSPFFDAFLRDIFVPLIAGGTICIPPADKDFLLPEKIVSWIDESKINLIHCVPSLFRTINNEIISSENFENLKYILLSGEKVIPSELINWFNLFNTRIQLVNLYGTTETTMIRTFYKIVPEDAHKATIPIGSPINDTKILISKNDFKPCNILMPGELYIISKYTTKGYLNSPELTHDKFLTMNSDTQDGPIYFKTGDIARILTNKMIELTGREDRQVKLLGIRIELEEIENVLIQSGFIKNTLVIKHNEKNGNESLLAFIIKREKLEVNGNLKNEVQSYLEDHLPEYMIPSIIELDEFPLLGNGKVNYKELISLLNTQTIVEPSNDMEAKILLLWKEILGDKPISVEESFHSVGGNSLSIMKLVAKIYKEFNIRISLSEIFNNFTIKKQAELINRSKKDSLFVIAKSEFKPAYNLSLGQDRLYFMYEFDKASTAYNLPIAWRINGEFDKNKIENALKLLIKRHESLRTEFRYENGKIVQVVNEEIDFNLQEFYIHDSDIASAISEFIRPFDLSKAPLIRSGIIIKENEKILIVDIHHIICDGMSQMILFDDFMALYKGEEIEPLNIQYKDYAEWEHNFKTTDEYISHREFWLKSLEGELPKLELPSTNVNEGKISDEGGDVTFKINRSVLDPIFEELKDEEVTIFSGLCSIFFIYLSQLTGQEDIAIGINTSGRMHDELEDVVGLFTKTLPIRYQIDMNKSYKDFTKDLHKYLIQANSKQIYDLSDIINELNKNKTTPVESLFEAMLVFQNFEDRNLAKGDDVFSFYEFENTTSKFPICLFVMEDTESFNFKLEYLSKYFTKTDIEFLILQFQTLVENISKTLEIEIIECIDNSSESLGHVEDNLTFNF